MKDLNLQSYFLLGLMVVLAALVFFIFRPFLYIIILAAIFAVISQPIYKRMASYTADQQGLAALLTIFVIIVIVFIPLTFLGMQIFQDSRHIYFSLTDGGGKDNILRAANLLEAKLQPFSATQLEFSQNINQYFKQGLGWLLQNLGSIFSNVVSFLVNSLIFVFAFYYFLRDGKKIKETAIKLSPLSSDDSEEIFSKLGRAINSVVKGNFFIALIHGAIVMLGFTLFGVPNAIFWGAVSVIVTLVPVVGVALVVAPAILFLLFTNQFVPALGLFLWGVVGVGLFDNFIGPKLVGRAAQLHPILVLFSVLGGIGFFGPIGFLLGPLVLILLFVLLDTYSGLAKSK